MKRYEGTRQNGLADVRVNGVPLNPRLDLWNHSPNGFNWGYAGSGAAQLAVALLADCLGDDEEAIGWHQDFKAAVVAGLSHEGWTLTEEEIRNTIWVFENE